MLRQPLRSNGAPLAFGLRQAIGDRVNDGWMMAHPAMAAFNLDAFGQRRGLLHAALPGADPVGSTEDRCRRDGRRLGKRSAEPVILLLGVTAARHLVDAPGIG